MSSVAEYSSYPSAVTVTLTPVAIGTSLSVQPPALPVPLGQLTLPIVTIAFSIGSSVLLSFTVTVISTVVGVSTSSLPLLEVELTPLQCNQHRNIIHLLRR